MISEPNVLIIASLPLAAITFGLVIVGHRQYAIERDKLRLELYNRRFAIYDVALAIRRMLEDDAFQPAHAVPW